MMSYPVSSVSASPTTAANRLGLPRRIPVMASHYIVGWVISDAVHGSCDDDPIFNLEGGRQVGYVGFRDERGWHAQ